MDLTRPPFKTANQLYEDCTAALDSHELTICMGYVMGLSDSLQTLNLACSPKELSLPQLTIEIVKYLREHSRCAVRCCLECCRTGSYEGFSLEVAGSLKDAARASK